VEPVLHLFGSEVGAYRLFTIIALAAATGSTGWMALRAGLGWRRVTAFLMATLFGALVGARLFAVATVESPVGGDAARIFALRFGDMAMFGGLGGAAIGGLLMASALGERPERLADMTAPAIALGIVLLRTGCLLAGCCFGKESDLPWAVTYPEGSLPHLFQWPESVFGQVGAPHSIHPIPIYEMIAGILLLVAAFQIQHRHHRDGAAFAVVVGGYAIARLLIHPLRFVEPGSTPAWFYPLIYAVVALTAATWILAPHLRPKPVMLAPTRHR
jgi:phosphatidylglycerol:prolipoprotein diacylglycerol transferase